MMQFAIVEGDKVLSIGRYQGVVSPADKHKLDPLPAGQRWLPVEYEDSERFDPDKHYRLAPLPPRVDGNCVVRTYPIVARDEA